MIYTNSDGGARGNPGPGAIGIVVRDEDKILDEYGEVLKGNVTNNVAEYNGLIRALEIASKHTQGEITCKTTFGRIQDKKFSVNETISKSSKITK